MMAAISIEHHGSVRKLQYFATYSLANSGTADDRGIAMRILSVRLSVCQSVCLSVTRVIPDKTEERSVQICIPYERTFF